jgi:ribulose-5-phosphate 4-epimerase/fuculose-1-phosphate aldolase
VSEYVKFSLVRTRAAISPFSGFDELNACRRKLLKLGLIGVAYDFERNWLRFEGSAIPSSESLTHAAIYESDAKAEAVIHCHDSKLWAPLLNQAPTSSKTIDYGTPELAYEIMQLFKQTDVRSRRILVMAGHAAGILTFGKDLEEAFAVLMHERKKAYETGWTASDRRAAGPPVH